MRRPPTRSAPNKDNSTHHVVLGNGSEKIGLVFLNEVAQNILQELPISDPPRPYTSAQRQWFGGSRRLSFKDDPNGFFDSFGMWNMTEGHLFPRPIDRFATGHRDADASSPGNVQFKPLLGDWRYLAKSFVPATSYTLWNVYLWLDYEGAPGSLTVAIYSNLAGSPDSSLKSTTVTTTTVNVYGRHMATFATGLAVTAGTTYHIVASGASTDNLSNHWKLGVNPSGSSADRSTDGLTWAVSTYAMYYRTTDADTARQWHFFNLSGADYKVSNNDGGGTSVLQINGDRGKATSGASTSLTDTGSGIRTTSWDTDMWAGAKVRIINGTGDGQVRSITSNNGTVLTVSPAWDINPGATSEYIIYDTPVWQTLPTTGLGAVRSKPAVVNSIVYFPQGAGVNIRKMQVDYTAGTNHAYADDGTNKQMLLEVFSDKDQGPQLWAAQQNAATLYYGTPTAWGVATTFTAIPNTYVGASDKRINALFGRDALYVLKEDSFWRVVAKRPIQIISGLEYTPGPYNGLGAVGGNDQIWFGWNHSLVRMLGSEIRDMLNMRQGFIGLPPGRVGVPFAGLNAGAWWFFAINGLSYNTSSVIVWNGQGYSEFYRAWTSGKPIRNLYWMTCPEGRNKLYMDVGGDCVYIEFPRFANNPQLDSALTYLPRAELVTTVFDAGDNTLEKVLHSVRLLASNISNTGGATQRTGSIMVYFQVDDEIGANINKGTGIWHFLGEFTGTKNVRTIKADEFEIDFGRVNRYRLKLEFITEQATDPLSLLSLESTGDIFSPLVYRWAGQFKVDSNQVTLEGDPDYEPDYIYDFLKRAYETATPLQMTSVIPQMHQKTVVLASAPIVARNWVRVVDGKATWGGYIVVNVKEPG